MLRILKLSVNNVPYGPATEEIQQEINLADKYLSGRGLYWLDPDATATEQINLYPAPAEAGLAISALVVQRPPDPRTGGLITAPDTTEPPVPAEARSGISDYAAAKAYGFSEDNVELRDYYMDSFLQKAERLRQIRNSMTRRGPVQMKIAGYHF